MNILDFYPEIEDAPVEIRMSRAKAADTPPEILERLSHDSFWFVRDLAASNPNTPIPSLINLTQDRDFRIRYDAKKTLDTIKSNYIERNTSLDDQILAAMQIADEQNRECTSRHDTSYYR